MGHPFLSGQTWPCQLSRASDVHSILFLSSCDPGPGSLPPFSFSSEKRAWGSQTRESPTSSLLLYQPSEGCAGPGAAQDCFGCDRKALHPAPALTASSHIPGAPPPFASEQL